MNIITGGIILIVYCFVIFSSYMFLSDPFEETVLGVENVNGTASDSYVEEGGGTVRTVFDLIHMILIVIPSVYFVYWCFHREPDWRFRQ